MRRYARSPSKPVSRQQRRRIHTPYSPSNRPGIPAGRKPLLKAPDPQQEMDYIESNMVRVKGLEPPRLAAPEPKSGASTNSATPALCRKASFACSAE